MHLSAPSRFLPCFTGSDLLGGQARGPGGGGEESGAQASREGWVLGVRCLEVLNRWSLKCPVEESSRPASKGWER